jgi:hypothetical protein
VDLAPTFGYSSEASDDRHFTPMLRKAAAPYPAWPPRFAANDRYATGLNLGAATGDTCP